MERKNANIDDVIRTVETASAKELEELAGIREAVEDLKGGRVATVDPVSRSVSALNHTIENSRPDFVAKAPSVDPIVDAMKRLNLGDVSRVVQEDVAQQEQRAKSTTPNGKKRRRKAIPEDVKAQRTEAAEHAREMFGQKGGAQKSQNQRDARGRFIGKSGSKAAAEDARAERAEKARRKEDDERLNAESGLLKKLSKVAEGIGNPSETRAVDALGYAVAGPLWAAGKELGGISKEVGGSLNGARKSIADVIRGNDDNSRRKGFFRRKSQNSADVVQVNTQKRTVQELQDQTSEIKEGNDKILSALDQIAKNTGKKKGGLLSKLFSLLGKGAGGVASLLMGRGMLKKAGALAFGALGAKKLVGMLRGGGKKTLAHEGGDLAARAAGKLGLKAVGKGALRAIPLVGTVAGGIYDAVTGWNDTEAQRRAFGLKSGQDPSFQQKAAYTLANVLDLGGLVSALVGSSPEALDTLNELAAALGNDPNFATTMTNALAGKQPLDATLTALAGLATGANKLPYFTGTDTVSQTDLTSVGRDILAKTSVLAVIQYLGLRELGTSGEKIPLLSTANTWSARQIFNGGITGALTGNADTATKLKTACTIGGVAFDGTANINLPGVNVAGNQNTSGNAATATKLQTACTINGVSFDGSKNIELTAEDLNLQEFINKANNAVQRSGDILSGGLTFENDSILAWIRNTDWAKIGFKNDADSDTDSYMWFETGDNGNEYFKWRSKQSTTTKDLMNLKWDALSVLVKALFSSEVKISTVNALRIFNSSFGAIFRRSEECLHIIPTRENEGENGDIGPLRPFTLNLRTGRITMGHGLDVTGDITTNAWVYANRFAINSGSTSWIDMRNQNVIFGRNAVSTSSAQALLRQDHAERKFFVGGLGNYQFGFYMINNSRTANGTDGQAYMDNNGNWLCGSQVIPGNYGNFDSRYVRDVRLGTRVVQLMARGGRYEKAGHAITGLRIIGEVDGDDEAIFRPIQKYINGTWYNVAQV